MVNQCLKTAEHCSSLISSWSEEFETMAMRYNLTLVTLAINKKAKDRHGQGDGEKEALCQAGGKVK